MKSLPWSWIKAVHVAKSNSGCLEIDWRWRNDQKRRAARKAVKKGYLKRIKGKPGADYFVITDIGLENK